MSCKRTGIQEYRGFGEYQEYRRALRAGFVIFLIVVSTLGGCARPQTIAVERLAVMPIENLSPDAQWDWRSRAAAAVVVYDLAGAKKIFARQVDSISAAQSMRAARLLEGYFFERNGRIRICATVQNLGTNQSGTKALRLRVRLRPVSYRWPMN